MSLNVLANTAIFSTIAPSSTISSIEELFNSPIDFDFVKFNLALFLPDIEQAKFLAWATSPENHVGVEAIMIPPFHDIIIRALQEHNSSPNNIAAYEGLYHLIHLASWQQEYESSVRVMRPVSY
jgi:hypothetical protein